MSTLKQKSMDLVTGDALIIHHPKIGYVWAWAKEDFPIGGSGSAIFKVAVNSELLPGVYEMTVNINQWTIYTADDPDVLKVIAQGFLPKWMER